MSVNLKLGLALAAVVLVGAAGSYLWSNSSSESATSSDVKAAAKQSAQQAPIVSGSAKSGATPSPSFGADQPRATQEAGGNAAVSNGVATESKAQNKVQRAEEKKQRAQAMSELSQLLAKGEKANPKEVLAALDKIEKTIKSTEGRQQIALSRQSYETGLKVHALTLEFGELTKSNKPQAKQRQQEILAEITSLQQSIRNAADATRQYAASQIKSKQ